MADDDTSPTTTEATNFSALDSGSKTTLSASTTNGNSAHLKQKRARSQLSCTPCRQGKLKCNRQHDPACDQCIKRNRESSCIYVPPPVKHKPVQNVKGRIRQLENLVVDLMNQNRNATAETSAGAERRESKDDSSRVGPFSQPTPPSDTDTSPQFSMSSGQRSSDSPEDIDTATKPFGQMKISKDEISYVGESHWGAILNSISDLKREVGEDEEEDDAAEGPPEQTLNSWGAVPLGGTQPQPTRGLGFVLGSDTNVTKEQLIANVPEKKVADRLLSMWFNSPDPFKPIIHAPNFQDEYRRFWRNPKDTPVMWLGLLYAIMSLAASFGLRDADPSSPQAQSILETVNKYHSLASSAAVLGDFTKPKQYTLECLMLYAAGLRSNNAFVNVWLMIGLIVRLALRMGYHRDPSHYSSITVFHGEMRRRVWAIISMIDVLISFQIGLPSIIKTIHSDTQPPRNLLDRDFNSSTKVLPASRGIDELTPSSYTRAKLRIVKVFANAAELSHATIAPSAEDTMRLDRELEEAKASVPPLLQMPEISEVVTDPAEQLMCRFNLDLLYLKTKIVLHRRYMLTPLSQLTPEEQQLGIGTSRKACIECALRVMNHHATIYTASQTGGQLESVKWYMGSISTHDFLLAAMIICLELSTQINDVTFQIQTGQMECPRKRAMMDALERSQQIWSDASGRKRQQVQFVGKNNMSKGEHMFDETEKAARAMGVMLDKVKRQMDGQTPQPQAQAQTTSTENNAPTPMTGLMQDMGLPTGSEQQSEGSGFTPFNGMISNYDWGNVSGVPDDYGAGGQVLFANNGTTGQPLPNTQPVTFANSNGNSQDSSPPNNQEIIMTQPDFSLIGDMLDVPVSLDWEMWDNEIIKGSNQHGFGVDIPDETDMQQQDAFNIRYGNAITGTGSVKPGNVFMGNGSGPVGVAQSIPGMQWGMMEEFDMGRLDPYSRAAAGMFSLSNSGGPIS